MVRKVDYDRRAVATVPCPHCGARTRQACKGAARPVKYTHAVRRIAATQALKAAGE